MDKMIDLLCCLLAVSFVYGTAIFTVLLSISSKLSNITKRNKELDLCNKELAYTMVCIGRKPERECGKWFTIDKKYTVYKQQDWLLGQIYDDDGTDWHVFRYDDLMLEAGGYLFARVKGGNDDVERS